jgi:hypothetical protein
VEKKVKEPSCVCWGVNILGVRSSGVQEKEERRKKKEERRKKKEE